MQYKLYNKKKFYIFIILLYTCIFLFYTACTDKEQKQQDTPTTKTTESTPESNELTLIMGGDALLHAPVYNDAKYKLPLQDTTKPITKTAFGYNFNKMFIHIAPIIAQYDLAFYNQETILGGKEMGLSSYPTFNSPQEFGDCMVNMGFNLVSLANNHTLDRGEQAIINSLTYWQNQSVLTAGSYRSFEDRNTPRIYKKNGITYALLAYTYGTNGIAIPKGKEYLVNVYTKTMLANDIANIRDKVDLLIVSMHWGDEYVFQPNAEQQDLAHYLAELGVNIVIGNHPHVVQPIEWINNTLVIYALGNMISAQRGLQKRIGMLAGIKVKKDSQNGQISLHDLHANLIYTYYNNKIKDFQIYPFTKLNDTILPNYKQIYHDYLQVVTQKDKAHLIRTIPLL